MWKQFWNDQSGAIISAELILLLSILAVGMTVGLASLRDSVATELGDVGQSISNVDQSYVVGGASSPSAASAGLAYSDAFDFCDSAGVGNQNNGRGIIVAGPVTPFPSTGE